MSSGNSDVESDPQIEKSQVAKHDHFDGTHRIETKEEVPGHANYYEKDGLRTEGDGQDHAHEPPVWYGRDYTCAVC
jgi:uncharacterized protein with von Willebrand factor type A (vWA) domain